jgi:hypothetical protein
MHVSLQKKRLEKEENFGKIEKMWSSAFNCVGCGGVAFRTMPPVEFWF